MSYDNREFEEPREWTTITRVVFVVALLFGTMAWWVRATQLFMRSRAWWVRLNGNV